MTHKHRLRLALGIAEVLVVAAAWATVDNPPAALATPASPVLVQALPGPAGITIDSPWISNANGTSAWAYGVTATGLGTLVSYAPRTSTFTTNSYATGEMNAIGAAYSPSSNVGAFTVARSGFGNRLVIVDLATGTKIASRQMASDETAIRAVAFDSTGSSVWLATNTNPLRIFKLSATTANQTSSLILSNPFKDATSAVALGNTLFLTLNTSPVKIVPVDMTTVTNSSSTSLPLGTPALVEPVLSGGIAYYGSDGTPGRITAIDLANRTVVGTLDLGADETGAHALTIDSTSGRLYTTTSTPTGSRLVSIDTIAWSRLGSLDLGAGTTARGTVLTGHRLSVGFGGARGVAALSIAPLPSTPQSVTVHETDRALTVSWTAASSLETITAYTVTVTGGGNTAQCSTTALSCTVSGLRNGVDYSVNVTATSLVGESPAIQSSGNPFTSPDSPTGVAVERLDRGLDVRWTPASDGGRSIIDYVASASPGGASCTTQNTSCTIPGLTNGRSYTVTVTARTVAGSSPASVSSNPVTPATHPSEPRNVTGERGNHEIVAHWEGPDDDGGLPVTGYSVTTTPASAGCDTSATTCTISGLTNGVPYRVTVVARNDVGVGPTTEAVATVTPATVPSAVLNISTIRGDRSAHVDWQAPADDGGSTIVGYRVVDAATGTLVCAVETSWCTVTGLTNGRRYALAVTAVNDVGASNVAMSDDVTPATAPAPLAAPRTTAFDGSATVEWDDASDDGGDPIIDFRVRVTTEGRVIGEFSVVGRSTQLDELSNGTRYEVSVCARNSVGPGAWSATADLMPIAPEIVVDPPIVDPPIVDPPIVDPPTTTRVPDQPTGVVLVRRYRSWLVVAWVAPADGGSSIRGYLVERSNRSNGRFVPVSDSLSASPVIEIRRPRRGTLFVRVSAVNAVGSSEPSTALRIAGR